MCNINNMKKFYLIYIFIGLLSFSAYAQNGDALGFYPNPVNSGKITITSKSNLDKEIVITDVLGKIVLNKKINNKELDVSNLREGIYFIKIKEGELSVTKKLIIN